MRQHDVHELRRAIRVDEAPGGEVPVFHVFLAKTEHLLGRDRQPRLQADRAQGALGADKALLVPTDDEVDIQRAAHRPVEGHGVPADQRVADADPGERLADAEQKHIRVYTVY